MKKLTHLQWFKYFANFVKVKFLKKLPGMATYDFR